MKVSSDGVSEMMEVGTVLYAHFSEHYSLNLLALKAHWKQI